MPNRTLSALILLQATLAIADTDELLRRAETRIAHGNDAGARALLRRVIEEDPSHGPALALLADLDPLHGTSLRFQYLRAGRPLDLDVAVRFLDELCVRVHDVSADLQLQVERATLFPADARCERMGPLLPWQLPTEEPLQPEPLGPLRIEAFGTIQDRWREDLGRIVIRLTGEGITSAPTWSRLARLDRRLGDSVAAAAALARAAPVDLREKIELGRTSLEVLPDPCGWWRREGVSILEGAPACIVEEESINALTELCREAQRALATSRDFEGVIRIARELESRTRPGANGRVAEMTVQALGEGWNLDEAYQRLAEDPDPLAQCISAQALFHMLQVDRALAILDQVVAGHPDCAMAWCELRSFYGGAQMHGARRRAEDHLVRIAREREIPAETPFPFAEGARASRWEALPEAQEASRALLRDHPSFRVVKDLLQFWRWRADEAPVQELSAAIEATWPKQSGTNSDDEVANIVDAFVSLRRPDVALRWAARLPVDTAFDRGVEDRDRFDRWMDAVKFMAVLREAASARQLPLAADEYVRGLCLGPTGRNGVPLWVCRQREELTKDRSFLDLPGGAYVLSLMLDPWLQHERASGLRKQACAAGCRAPGLLRQLAREGEDVLEALREADPAEARTIEALRSDDPTRIEELLDRDDELRPRQVAEIQVHLARLGHPTGEAEASVEEVGGSRRIAADGEATTARSLLDLLTDPPAWSDAGRTRPLFDGGTELCAAVRSALLPPRTAGEGQLPRVSIDPYSSRPVDAPRDSEEAHLLRSWASRSAKLSAEEWNTALQAMAERHPLDLRWGQLAMQRAAEDSRDVWHLTCAALRDSHTRNPCFLAASLATCEDPVEADRILDLVLSLLDRERPSVQLGALEWTSARKAPPLDRHLCDRVRALLPGLALRCDGEEDLAAVSSRASNLGLGDLSSELDTRLFTARTPWIRTAAVLREADRRRDGVDWLLGLAMDGHIEELGRAPILHLLNAACGAGREDAAFVALEASWRLGWPAETDNPGDRVRDWEDARRSAWLGEVLDRRASGEGLPPWGWSFLWRMHCGGRRPKTPKGTVAQHLLDAGYVEREAWLEALRTAPLEEMAKRVRALVDGLPAPEEVVDAGEFVASVAQHLGEAGDPRTAVEFARAWADRCGPIAIQDSHDPPLRQVPPELRWHRLFSEVLWQVTFGGSGRALVAEGLPALLGALSDTRDPATREALISPLAWPAEKGGRERAAAAMDWEQWRCSRSEVRRQGGYERLCYLLEHNRSLIEVCAECLLADHATDPEPPSDEVRAWEQRLSDPDVASRDAASGDLALRGERGVALVRALLRSTDPEVSSRAAAVLEEIADP